MSDILAEYLRRAGLGRVDERLALRGHLELPGEGQAPAHLVRVAEGVFLAAAKSPSAGVHHVIDADARFVPGRVRDTFVTKQGSFDVPVGDGQRARTLIGLSRFPIRKAAPPCIESRFIESTDEVTTACLRAILPQGDALLACLETDLSLSVSSSLLGQEVDASARFVLYSSLAALVSVTELGDHRVDPLDVATLRVDKRGRRATITTAAFRFRSTRSNGAEFAELSAAVGKRGAERDLEVARLCFISRQDRQDDREVAELLARLGDAGDQRARVLETALALELRSRVPQLPPLDAGELSPEDFAGLWQDWRLSPETAKSLVERARRAGHGAHALSLHRALHRRLTELRDDAFHLAEADANFAQHLLDAGERDAARTLLTARLEVLPRDVHNELLPPTHADLTTGAASRQRVRLLELLARTRQPADPKALAALASLEPLVPSRIDELVGVAEGGLAERARRVSRVLEIGGLDAPASAPSHAPASLADTAVDEALRHPAAPAGSDVLGRLQAMLAAVPLPNHAALRDYVEPLAPRTHPHPARILKEVARMFGVPNIEGYISRGRKAVGVRSYEGSVPFVLIGGRHLDPTDPARLTDAELYFAMATEVAHIRYGHSRVTSSEVWAGAIGKSKEGLDFALGVLPLFRGVRALTQVTKMADQVPVGAIRRTVTGALALRRGLLEPASHSSGPAQDEGLSALNEQLVAAHRLMQLTADRAGLVACGDPVSALRAMLLVRVDLHAVLERAMKEGLDPVLATRDEAGALCHQDLAIRASQLLSFYLSDDFEALRR